MITKPPPKPDPAKFIADAPDAAAQETGSWRKSREGKPALKRVLKGDKFQISFTIAPPLLAQVDKIAEETFQSRAAVITQAITKAINHGLLK
jgi:hypothetical protein